MHVIELDGSEGEGGGQILRTALALAMITGKPFRIERIRARRPKPGLLRQHLTAVRAAAEICGARVSGAELRSQALSFAPGPIRGGDYRFAIGTAGSCTLVLQTLLPALWFADGPSTISVTGGTHNPAAPPADFLIRSWLPLMRKLGVDTGIELVRHGFHPAGGGEAAARVRPVGALRALDLTARSEPVGARVIAVVAGVPENVARRELDGVAARLGPIEQEVRVLPADQGPGNVLMVELIYPEVTAVFTAFGRKGLPAEVVAGRAAQEAQEFRDSGAVVDEHLADQLLLPVALAGRGTYLTTRVSSHLQTNIDVVAKFLAVDVRTGRDGRAARVALGTPATAVQRPAS